MPTYLDLRLTFNGSFNVGAGAMGGSLADKPLTRDARGLPMVPASAFKGRLRHEVERLTPGLRPDEKPPCGSPVAKNMCQGEGELCPVCRLFGSPWRLGRLIFSDLTLVEPDFLTTGGPIPLSDLRYGVGLSRQRRVAEEHLLYTREAFLPGAPITLAGTIAGELDNADLELLEAGLKSLFAVGGGKTGGMGWFDLAWSVREEPFPGSVIAAPPGQAITELDIVITLKSPLLVGRGANEAFYRLTRQDIPGSVLRGSLVRQMLAACRHAPDEPHHDCDFGRLFEAAEPPVFENLYPTPAGSEDLPLPALLSARSCKYHPGFINARDEEEQGHGVGDVLIPQVVFEEMLAAGIPLPLLYQPRCPKCGAEAKPFEASLVMFRLKSGPLSFDNVPVSVRRTSRTAIDRRRAVAAEGQLYTLEVVDPLDSQGRPTTFRGAIRASPEQTALLQHWLGRLNALGSGQSRGLGRVQIKAVPPGQLDRPLPPLAERLEKFNQAVQAEWDFYCTLAGSAPLPGDTTFFCLDLLSPVSLTRRGLPAPTLLPDMLGLPGQVHLIRAFAAYNRGGGWHLKAGLPRRTELTIEAGSVFMYRCDGLALADLEPYLALLEAAGLSAPIPRNQGLGRVAACLPFHYQPEVNL